MSASTAKAERDLLVGLVPQADTGRLHQPSAPQIDLDQIEQTKRHYENQPRPSKVSGRVTFGEEDDMTIRRSLISVAVILGASTSASYASPCSEAIDRMQARIDAKLEAAAAAGPSTVESSAATMHRQPTPRSIAAAEVQLGGVSKEQAETVGAAMARAREAERGGDQSACEQALSDAERALSQR